MALPYPKPTSAAQVRNRYCPQGDKLAVMYPFREGSGTTINNIVENAATDWEGADADSTEPQLTSATITFTANDVSKWIFISGGTNWIPGWYQIFIVVNANSVFVVGPVATVANPTGGTGFIHRTGRKDWTWNGSVVGGAPTWVSGGGVELDGTNYIKGGGNTTGANATYNRGTLTTRFEITDDAFLFTDGAAVLSYVLNNMGVETAAGRLNVLCSRDSIVVRLGLGTSSTDAVISLTGQLFADDQVTVILSWGNNLNWTANVSIFRPSDSSYQNYINVDCGAGTGNIVMGFQNTNSWVFGTDRQFNNRVPSIWYDFYLHDWRLTQREIDELINDPSLPTRPLVASTLITTTNAPLCGRPQTNSLYFQLAGAKAITPGTPAAQFRIRYGLNKYLQGAGTSFVYTISTADQARPIGFTVGALTEYTRYYYQGEYSLDSGTTWYPFAAGKGTAKTLPVTHPRLGLNIAFISDSHAGLVDSSDTIIRFGLDLNKAPDSASGSVDERILYRIGRSSFDLIEYGYRNEIQLVVDGGDSCWNDAGTNRDSNGWNVGFYNVFKTACYFHVAGNHEETMPYMLNVSDGSYAAGVPRARESRIKNKSHCPNPTNTTYPQGGENSGTPLEATSDGTLWIPDVEWIPAMTEGGDTFQDDFVYETPGAATHLLRLGAHNSPLQTYYAVPVSNDLLIIVIDVCSFCLAQPDYNDDQRWNQDRLLGQDQWEWLQTTLANSTHKHKIVVGHSLINGIKSDWLPNPNDYAYYQRGSGVTQNNCGEDVRLINLLRNNRVTAYVKGHDHGFAHTGVNTLNMITMTTFSHNGKFTAEESAAQGALYPLDYGNPAKQGTDQKGVQASYAQWGWVVMQVKKEVTITLRQTCVDVMNYSQMGSDFITLSMAGRWVGKATITDANGNLKTPELPSEVYFASTAADGDFFNLGDSAPIFNDTNYPLLNIYDPNNQGFATGGSEIALARFDAPFSEPTIILNQAPRSQVRAQYSPREVYSAELSPAIPLAGGCCGCG